VADVVELVQSDGVRPIAEIPLRERLGVLLTRYRLAAGLTVSETAERLGVTETILTEVELHQLTLPAGQLQSLAAFFGVRYEPLLDAARDYHRAIWEDSGQTGGVQLESVTTSTRSLGRQPEHALELELIQCSDELVFLANVCREAAIKAEAVAMRARELLASRGVEVPGVEPIEGPTEVECFGPKHRLAPKKLVRGRDLVVVYQSDGEPPSYFCSQKCGNEWAAQRRR